MTKSSPDMKEAYGKMKKEENVIEDNKTSDVKPSSRQKPLSLKFINVAFLEEHGDRFWFFKTHVIPGKALFLLLYSFPIVFNLGDL